MYPPDDSTRPCRPKAGQGLVLMTMNILCLMMLDSCRMVPPFMLSPMVSTTTSQPTSIRNQYLINLLTQPPLVTIWREKYQKNIKNHKFCSGYIHRCTGLIVISKNVQTQTEISIWQINSEKLYCPSIYRGAANSICETKKG